MHYINEKVAPKREERLGSCIEFGGTAGELKKQFVGGCLRNNSRGFCQGSICQLLPGTAILNSIPESVVIVHGSLGCGGAGHNQNASIRWRQSLAGSDNPKGTLWLTTNLNKMDVVSGGEGKLEEAVLEADRRYRPASIIVVSTCVPGIIGDDIDAVAARIQPRVNAVILPVHCEGFNTKIMATAYDAIYHAIGRNLLDVPPEEKRVIVDELEEAAEKIRKSRLVNLFNVSSMTPFDENELVRILKAIGLEVNIYPCFAHPEDMWKATEAALSISTCPTHDDYILSHLQEKYHIPYILKHMPIGINNTNQWLRDIAKFFALEDNAEKVIAAENAGLEEALAPIRKNLRGKKAMLSAGEIRTFATAVWLQELGMEIVAVRPYHYDEFGEVELDKLAAVSPDLKVNVATVHPYETVNLIERHRPDLYLGHSSDNIWAAKLGIPILPIYGGANTYVGYVGAFDIARRINRVLKNISFNRHLRNNVRQPYYQSWYGEDPFKYIQAGGMDR
ncbi:MAG: Nitrogenase molybdenum-iron protein alpha chain [Pelotomaculum sp. PtaU1.Bin035]|nr:MAG: Nitrogenase molybdenum-iron protein alpha chain [Pelotomaculum sp. PtaU1.Bin035]